MTFRVTAAHDQDAKLALNRVTGLASEAAEFVREELGEASEVIGFGSWAKGTARPHSDIDLAVIPSGEATSRDWGRLRERIEELPTLYSFDLVDISEASETLRSEIQQHGVRV
ncbi:nucleotidyltransferase family protein [Thioalkalivibrio sp. ALMg9]|uniref:nucleotidyltransferase family protein n=1 Tax=Thioalkalivibrio sp. ALMg9 TaxID=1266912 RepID=UPI000363D166|nr:nucleotidyltransferase domain-containing protein [Thioalkalivibrio sp. ALMg9]